MMIRRHVVVVRRRRTNMKSSSVTLITAFGLVVGTAGCGVIAQDHTALAREVPDWRGDFRAQSLYAASTTSQISVT